MMRIIIMLLCISNCLAAQTAEQVLDLVNEAYLNQGAYTCDVRYKYFSSSEATIASDSSITYLAADGDAFCIQYNNIDLLSDGTIIIQIDSSRNTLVVQKGILLSEEYQMPLTHKWMRTVGKKMEKIGIGSNTLTFRYFTNQEFGSQIEYVDFVINTNTWLIAEMHMQYKNAPIIKDDAYVLTSPIIVISFDNYQKFQGDFQTSYGLQNWITVDAEGGAVTLKNAHFELIN
jgi:hypothetical protein